MKNKLYSIFTAFAVTTLMLLGCSTAQHLPKETIKTVTVVKDSLVVRTDTLTIEVPVESHTNVTKQHSFLETSVATSTADVDSLGLLHHELTNKQTELKKEIHYIDRYVTQIDTVYQDVIRYQDVEVIKYKVPRWCWYLVLMNVLTVISLFIISYLRFKGKFKL